MENSHGHYSPSQLALRSACPGSVHLEGSLFSGGRETLFHGSEAAETGTEKHLLCQDLRAGRTTAEQVPDDVRWAVEQVQAVVVCLPEGSIVVEEYQIDLTYLGIPNSVDGNRIDLLAIVPGRFGIVIDYKFGFLFAESPAWNWQIKTYCAGVARAFGVPQVQGGILQPNVDEQWRKRYQVFDATELEEAEKGVRKIIARCEEPGAQLVRGDHCTEKFCKARLGCPLWKESFLQIPTNDTLANFVLSLTPDRRRSVYENLITAKKFAESGIEEINALAVAGKLEIEGYEIGPGRKKRDWKDQAQAIDQLSIMARERGMEVKEVVEPISPAAAEKKFPKTLLAPLITTTEGKLSLQRS